jgi:autophagy-related protein 13
LGDLPFGIHRSISLGADDREPPSLSALLGLGQTTENVASTSSPSPHLLQPAPHISETAMSRQASSSLEAQESEPQQVPRGLSAGSMHSPYRPRLGKTGGRGGSTPQTGSNSSLMERGSGSGSERASGRYSFTRPAGTYEADDEPLLFQMSEIGRDNSGRRSLEEPRGGGNVGSAERGGFEPRGGDSGSSSRRGSRRW